MNLKTCYICFVSVNNTYARKDYFRLPNSFCSSCSSCIREMNYKIMVDRISSPHSSSYRVSDCKDFRFSLISKTEIRNVEDKIEDYPLDILCSKQNGYFK